MTNHSLVQPLFIPKLAIIGLGLIGGSWVQALRAAGCVGQVVGFDANADSMVVAKANGVIDEIAASAAEAVVDADFVIVSVPILAMRSVLQEIACTIKSTAVLTDVGSVKGSVAADVEAAFGKSFARFVLGHPIAGSERSGVTAINAELFQRHKVIITPQAHTDASALNLVTQAWLAAGAEVEVMGIEHHDEILAATSHLPHLLAYSLVNTLASNQDNKEYFNYAAGGFRDFTRIAASSPIMWRDIFSANKTQILHTLNLFESDLKQLRQAIEQDDSTYVMGVLTRAKVARDHFSKILAQRAYMESSNMASVTYIANPSHRFFGTYRVPGDKSISHRSIMLGSIAEGVTEVEGFLEGEDSLATLQAFRDMGVVIEGPNEGKVTVHGVGLHGLKTPPGPIYLGNSGTSIRLLAGLYAGQAFDTEMTGDASLSTRPMNRVADPLRLMGAQIETADGGRPPLKLTGSKLKGIHYDLPMASAQVKSCVLLAGLYAEGQTSVTEPAPTRDHTERMLKGFGYPVKVDGSTVTIESGGKLAGTHIDVPGDISSAAFLMVAASIADEADITLEHVGINPTRIGIINILRAMGGKVEVLNEREVGGEPVADIRVQSADLKGIHIPEDQVPLAIDEFPVLFIAAACAEGETVLTGAEELRVKESDRIQVMMDGLQQMGIECEGTADGAIIQGMGKNGVFGKATVTSHHDHRIAMSFTVASLRAAEAITIEECQFVDTSFPTFVDICNEAGMQIDVLTKK